MLKIQNSFMFDGFCSTRNAHRTASDREWRKPLTLLLSRFLLCCVLGCFSSSCRARSCFQRFNWILCNTLFQCLFAFAPSSWLFTHVFQLGNFSISFPFWFLHYFMAFFAVSLFVYRRVVSVKLNWAKLSAQAKRWLKCEKSDAKSIVRWTSGVSENEIAIGNLIEALWAAHLDRKVSGAIKLWIFRSRIAIS